MVTPRCPHCNTQGLKNLARTLAGPFAVIYCARCGAIFGVMPLPEPNKKTPLDPPHFDPEPELPKPVEADPPPPEPEPDFNPASAPPGLLGLAGNTDISLAPISPDDARQRIRMVNMFGPGGKTSINVMGKTGICPTCNCKMIKMIIPAGYQNSGQVIYYCPHYDQCGQWYFYFLGGND